MEIHQEQHRGTEYKKAHIRDGVAVTKFIYWVKKNMGKIHMTELSISKELEQLRSVEKAIWDQALTR